MPRMSAPWTTEDLAVWDSLVQGGYIPPEEPPSLLTVVNAAASYERTRILRNLFTLPEHEQDALAYVITWIMMGAPDYDPG